MTTYPGPQDPVPSTPQGGSGTTAGSTTGTGSTSGTTSPTGTSSTTGAGAGSTGSTARDTAHTAKQEAAGVAQTAAGAGQHVLEEAKTEAAGVAHEARRQVRGLLDDARSQAGDQAAEQQRRLAGGMHTAGRQLSAMADRTEDSGVAVDLVAELGHRLTAAATWFEEREPSDVLDEVRRFARRRPGTFLLAAAGAGLLVGRLARSLKDAPAEPQRTRTSSASAPTRVSATERVGTTPAAAWSDTAASAPATSRPSAGELSEPHTTPSWPAGAGAPAEPAEPRFGASEHTSAQEAPGWSAP